MITFTNGMEKNMWKQKNSFPDKLIKGMKNHALFLFYLYWDLISFLLIFPTLVFGISLLITIFFGTPYFGITPFSTYFIQKSWISFSVTSKPPFNITIARGTSPHFSSGTPTTATSLTPSC